MVEPHSQFVKIEASRLSLTDDFMQHVPKTAKEKKLKARIEEAISSGVNDFFRPNMDPSFDKTGRIVFAAGISPATGKSYKWWEKAAKNYCPERKSRLGNKNEYAAFVGVLIKKLVSDGVNVSEAWNLVCNEAHKLAHFANSFGHKHMFETTGSREAFGFYDLANTYKILMEDPIRKTFPLASGTCHCSSVTYPLCGFFIYREKKEELFDSVGWIVLEN